MHDDKLKAAILNRDFNLAQLLIQEWGNAVNAELKSSSEKAELCRIYNEALSFAERHIYLARVIRAYVECELQSNSGSFFYRDTDLEQHRWNLRA